MVNSLAAKTFPSTAINLVEDMEKTDIRSRESEIVNQVTQLTSGKFKPIKLISRSDYFGTGRVGAFHYLGDYQGSQAVLKIQAAQPKVSESWMIEQFAAQNLSQLIRPPKVYEVIPWNVKRGYEALIMEFVAGQKVLDSHQLQTKSSLKKFFQVYQEYRQFSLINPWLPKPELNFEQDFQKLISLAKTIQPNNPHRRIDDLSLALHAKKTLLKIWSGVELEFQHGHFSAEDLIYHNNQIVLFSNLFWKWKMPFYDAVFAYHWAVYGLASVQDITPEKIEAQRQLWLAEIVNLPNPAKPTEQKLLTAALLERAIAGLMVDCFAYIDDKHPLAGQLMSSTRTEVVRLTRELEKFCQH